jgi:hypothetical protein
MEPYTKYTNGKKNANNEKRMRPTCEIDEDKD